MLAAYVAALNFGLISDNIMHMLYLAFMQLQTLRYTCRSKRGGHD